MFPGYSPSQLSGHSIRILEELVMLCPSLKSRDFEYKHTRTPFAFSTIM